MNIGLDMAGRLQGNRAYTDDTQDSAAHDHLLACNHPRHLPVLTDENFGSLNGTLYVAIDLQRAPANNPEPLTDNFKVVPDDRFLAARWWG